MKRFKDAGIPVVAVFLSGRPLWVNPELNVADAFVAAWLPGSEGNGIADVIFRNERDAVNHDFKGKLSYSWPRYANQPALNRNDANYAALFAYGFGLTYADKDDLGDTLPTAAAP
jgi:beta-glucosidase